MDFPNLTNVDQRLKDYPTWHDLWKGRYAFFLLIGGIVLGYFYFGEWKNPLTDFAIWCPVAFGMATLFSQIIWRTVFYGVSARQQPILSAAVFLGCFILVGLVIG